MLKCTFFLKSLQDDEKSVMHLLSRSYQGLEELKESYLRNLKKYISVILMKK